jgi:hypothetical protein
MNDKTSESDAVRLGFDKARPLSFGVPCPVFDFDIQKCTRRCCETDRELQPGDVYYSVLIAEGANIVRRDYAEEAWPGPPDAVIGWWKSTLPDVRSNTMRWAPNDVMLHFFLELEGRADSQDTRYILTLLMLRRRVVRLEETETDDQGRECLVVYCSRNETEYRVAVIPPTEPRVAEIQQQLANLLMTSAA